MIEQDETYSVTLDLKALRKAMGLRYQKDLAIRMGVTVDAVKNWELGRHACPKPALILLGHILLWMYGDNPDPFVQRWRHLLGELAMEPWQA